MVGEKMLSAYFIKPKIDLKGVSPVYKKEFCLQKPVKKAVLYITARGTYKAYINGKRVGDFVLAPGLTSYEKRLQVQEYDVTDLISNNNEIIVEYGVGWYLSRMANEDFLYPKAAGITREGAIIAELKLYFTDGSTQSVITDDSWLVASGKTLFSDIYDGTVYDASKELRFNINAVLAENQDKSMLIAQQGEIVCEQERIKPIAVLTTQKGETVLDFGQNLTGYLEISLDAKKGDKAEFSFGEILDKDGNFYNENFRSAKCLYDYTCSDGFQTYKPDLTFYGFRYVRVDKFPTEITKENFKAIVVHSNMERTGYIETSNPLLNKLFSNIIWGQKGNFLDIPTDCPQRDERKGWTGDAQVFVKTASYNFNVNRFFRKWLYDMAAEQAESGAVSKIVPMYDLIETPTGTSSGWGDAVTICPWQMYLTYGDKELLEFMFEPMKKWVDYITNTTEKEGLWIGGWHYSDWLELKAPKGEYNGDTREAIVATAYYAKSCELVIKAGKALGKDISYYEALYQKILASFKKEFNDTFKTQAEFALTLAFGLTDQKEKVAADFVEMIHNDGDMLQTGFMGTPVLLYALSQNGYLDLAYKLLLREEMPSWLYPVTKGATTIWEHWDGVTPDGELGPADMNSYNHYAYGAVADWIYSVAAGINTVDEYPAFEHVLFTPHASHRLERLTAKIKTKFGEVESGYKNVNGKPVYKIKTPVDAVAVIEGKEYKLTAGEYEFEGEKYEI